MKKRAVRAITGLLCAAMVFSHMAGMRVYAMEGGTGYKDWGNGYGFRASSPKTRAGIRTIPFTESVYKAFLEQKKINFMLGRRSTEEIDGYSDFIFLAKTGRPLMPSAVNNVIYNVVDKYNKEEVANDVTMDVYNHIAGRQDVREEVERYALVVGG